MGSQVIDPPFPSSKIRLYGGCGVWAPTGAEASAFDRWASDRQSVPSTSLMECAGRCAAELLNALYPVGTVVGVVGGGNNGGDALVLLRTLAAWGRTVRALVVSDDPDVSPLLHAWPIELIRDEDLESANDLSCALGEASVLVDGLLGTGVRGAPRPRQARIIEAMNRAPAPVIALDVPSGVDAANGQTPGAVVQADVTVAFGWPKLGSLLHPARAFTGRLISVEIGFPPASKDHFGAALLTPGWATAHRPVRRADAHKGDSGSVLLLAGREGMAGAGLLAGRAALRVGLGLLRIASVPQNRAIIQAALPEAIFVDASDPAMMAEAAARSAIVVAGPGLGTDVDAARSLEYVLAETAGKPTVLDADALNLVASSAVAPLASIAASRPLLITPHPGEMERVSSFDRDAQAGDRIQAARATSEATGATVLLKGLPSVVASPEGTTLIDTVGNSDLATAGMGDVLAGVCGGFLAQGVPLDVAAGLALYTGGRSAVLAGRGVGLLPEDVIESLPRVMEEDGSGVTDLDFPFVNFDQDAPR